MGYQTAAVKGFSWQTALKVASAGVTFVKISIIAHLLPPEVFGVFSLVMIALGVSEATTQTGVNITLLQSKKPISYFIDTAWVIAIVRGVLISVVMLGIGSGLQVYFNQVDLLKLIAVVSLVPLIKGFINPAIIGWRKNLRFFQESSYFLSLTIVDAVISIIATALLRNVYGLILGIIGSAVWEVGISFWLIQLRPTFRYLANRARIILQNAKWLSMASLMGYLNDNLDDFIVGSTTSTRVLGLYHNAYALSHKPNYDVARSASHGLLPIFSQISSQPTRLRTAFFKSLLTTTTMMTIASLPIVVFPDTIVRWVLGDQWLEIIPVLNWLVLAGISHSIALIGYTLLIATQKYTVMNLHQLINLVLTILLMTVLSSSYGLQGAVIGLTMARLVALPILTYGTYQALNHTR